MLAAPEARHFSSTRPRRQHTITHTIRIDESLDRLLRQVSDNDHITMNSIVASALRRFAEWDVYADRFGFVTVPSTLLTRMMSLISDEDVRELGRWAGGNLTRDLVVFWFKQVSLDTVLEAMRLVGSKYGRAFEFEHSSISNEHIIVVKHNRGIKWSIFYDQSFRTVFRELLHKEVKSDFTENQVVFHMDAP
jgi:hypothetical protein